METRFLRPLGVSNYRQAFIFLYMKKYEFMQSISINLERFIQCIKIISYYANTLYFC